MALGNFESRVTRLFLEAGAGGVDGTEQLFFNGADEYQMGNTSTVMNFGFRAVNFTLRGSRRVSFAKTKITTMFRNISPVVYLYTPRSHREVATELIRRYGLPLKPEWFVDTPIPTEVGNSPDFVVRLRQTRTLFTVQSEVVDEELPVRVLQADVDLKDIFTDVDLNGLTIPYTIRQGYTNTELLTFSKDFTPETRERFVLLRDIATSLDLYGFDYPNSERSANLAELMSSRMGIAVSIEGDLDQTLSLKNATLVYNGAATGFPKSDTWYENVLVFDTVTDAAESSARDYRGRCYVHYNTVS